MPSVRGQDWSTADLAAWRPRSWLGGGFPAVGPRRRGAWMNSRLGIGSAAPEVAGPARCGMGRMAVGRAPGGMAFASLAALPAGAPGSRPQRGRGPSRPSRSLPRRPPIPGMAPDQTSQLCTMSSGADRVRHRYGDRRNSPGRRGAGGESPDSEAFQEDVERSGERSGRSPGGSRFIPGFQGKHGDWCCSPARSGVPGSSQRWQGHRP